jgi:hypothetical protein
MFTVVCLLAPSERPPMPESLLTESATDVDAEEAGEVEYETNLPSSPRTLRARREAERIGRGVRSTVPEAPWERRRLGLKLRSHTT